MRALVYHGPEDVSVDDVAGRFASDANSLGVEVVAVARRRSCGAGANAARQRGDSTLWDGDAGLVEKGSGLV